MNRSALTGQRGEAAAAEWLRRHGYLIVERNWRCGRHEIDIVADEGDRLHLVEVKCRRAGGLTLPEDALTPAKSRALLKAANAYIEMHAVGTDVQIDLIAVDDMPDGSTEVRFYPEAVRPKW